MKYPVSPRGTILVVDDDHENLRLLMGILNEQNYSVRLVPAGRLALTSARTGPPDVILLDIMLPDIDGYAVCEHLKADERTRDIPIIFLSALDEVFDKVKGFSIGGVDYITKPFQVEEVLARVATHLSLRSMQKRLQEQNEQLQQEIIERQHAQEQLRRANEELDLRVQERTAELFHTNRTLHAEIERRKQAEQTITAAYTDLEATNEHLLRSRNLLRAIFDGLEDGLLLLDQHGTVLALNKAMAGLFGSTPEALVNHAWDTLSAHIVSDFPFQIATQALAYGTSERQRIRYRHPDGTIRALDIQTIVPNYPAHTIDQVILHVVDVTEHLLLQAQVIENERFAANGRLAASVAHEINTPLQSLELSLQIAQTSLDTDRNLFLRDAREELQRVGRIVRQFLDLYRPGSTACSVVDINTLIERILLLTGKQIRDRKITIERSLQDKLPPIWGHADELIQVLLNLTINAIDAMPDGGTLRVCTHAHPSPSAPTLTAIISDTGVGISPDLLLRIFEPFVTTKENGTGLGLSISRQIVRQHGGDITVQSQSGMGSTFTVVLPIVSEPEAKP
ncbi:MAG: response regulator [Chloroflexaceae bacterium]|nr:response regulator [Chloroflexaceae bacterium]